MVALFVFVKPLYYTQSCLASIFYTAGVLLIQQDNHVGSALFACAIAAGHLIAGILLAGLMVRICGPRRLAHRLNAGLFIGGRQLAAGVCLGGLMVWIWPHLVSASARPQ